ncbi:hypothetical protein CFOL_v3_00242 [Cephalotus follicularis]|uniref:tRNA pseudouridine(55) synthase n=1 Tax=Cephalotus follicularis TaxID=3775 RepID=A0A1Q3AM35_CEPFO|nr:hypothetical protein CFOL_v3_00242 [Cephalotus follicularis]
MAATEMILDDAVRSLPSHAVKELLSIGVCARCILRLFGVRGGPTYYCSSLSPSLLLTILGEPTDPLEATVGTDSSPSASKESELEPLCSICLGILQFIYCDDKEMLVKKDSAHDLALTIAELVKQDGHTIDSFSLEVSMPPVVLENEQAVWLQLKRKYESEVWFQERSLSGLFSAKEALKYAVINPLETLLDVQSSGLSSLRIRLTYSHSKASNVVQNSAVRKQDCKRRKTAATVDDESMAADIECSTISTNEAIKESSFNGLQDHVSSKCIEVHLGNVGEPCHMVLSCYKTPVYLAGRYLKYSRNVSQTRWIIDEERMGEASVEEIIGSSILPMCQGDNYKFHAAGREDMDVRMLGSGRPFLIEIQNPRQVPSEASVKEMETKINLENKLVKINNLKAVGSQCWTLMREGEAEKQKQYAALVWISRPLEDKDLESVSSLKDMQILQRTPIRVLHRRSPLEREKIIHWMKIERIAGSSQYFLLHLCTQAGTYIKEFVHGDLGRTSPSIGSILGCRAEILQLDVTEVKMDCFLDE